MFLKKYYDADKYIVTLYGSLAATGKGHLTGVAIEEAFVNKNIEVKWEPETFLPRHPNALKFEAFNKNNNKTAEWTAYSIGGGAIIDDNTANDSANIYPLTKMDDILEWCNKYGKNLWEYVEKYEGNEIWDFLAIVWKQMKKSIKNGLQKEGTLP
jgi:L-serine dehydratase